MLMVLPMVHMHKIHKKEVQHNFFGQVMQLKQALEDISNTDAA